MQFSLRQEWQALKAAVRTVNRQTVVVLLVAVVLVFVQDTLGSRRFFREMFDSMTPAHLRRLLSWGWWFGVQGITGFVIPVLILVFGFRRRPGEIGLGLGDWKLASVLALAYVPLVIVGTWVLSDGAAFQQQYPHLRDAVTNWQFFLIYELLFLFYWIGWEYLWRGFVLFGTAPTFGLYAIFIQTVPFALLHADKPFAEALLSIVGGVALGALVWRCRAFWIAVPIHAFQMLMIDLWCTLRIRTGTSGIGLQALMDVIGLTIFD